MSIYEEILYSEIKASVYESYGIVPPVEASLYSANSTRVTSTRYTLNYGGVIRYLYGNDQYQATVSLLDWQRTLDYILEEKSMSVSTIISALVGTIPIVGGIYTAIVSFTEASRWHDVQAADYNTKIYTVCNVDDLRETSTVVTGWHTFPYYDVPTYATNVEVYYADRYVET